MSLPTDLELLHGMMATLWHYRDRRQLKSVIRSRCFPLSLCNCMMTSSNRNILRVTGHLCGEFTGPHGEFPAQGPLTRSLNVFFDLGLNKWLSKQSWGLWFETLLCPLWRHCNSLSFHLSGPLCQSVFFCLFLSRPSLSFFFLSLSSRVTDFVSYISRYWEKEQTSVKF